MTASAMTKKIFLFLLPLGDFLTISAVSSRDEIALNSQSITAVPNPAQGQITLGLDLDQSYKQVDLHVLNSIGQIILTKQQVAAQGQVQLDLQGWQVGTYFYGLYQDGRLIARNSFQVQ